MVDLLLDLDLDLAAATAAAPAGGRRRAIEAALRAAIGAGRLAEGAALPSSRALAADLGVARGTVVDAYAQLAAEGWLSARPGGRTVVSAQPDAPPGPPPAAPAEPPMPLSPALPLDLRAGAPDLAAFPTAAWTAAVRAVLTRGPADALDYAPPRGRPELRAALAAYVARARGVVAAPDQVVVCAGFDHALDVVTRALVATGRATVAMEDPCLPFHRGIVAGAGAAVVPVPVDGAGLDPGALAAGAGAVVATPARHCLLGVTLAPDRRSALVAWARRVDGVVVEDDYDGELRYDRQPLGAVQGRDPERVVYAGTLSKSLAPGLRLAWVVVPRSLAGAVDAQFGPHSPVSSLDQLVVTEMLGNLSFERHLRRARAAYRRRRDRFVALLAARAPAVRVEGVSAGLHALVRWPTAAGAPDEPAVAAEAAARGIALTGLRPGWHGAPRLDGLLVGYGRPPAHDVQRRFDAFARLMSDVVGGSVVTGGATR